MQQISHRSNRFRSWVRIGWSLGLGLLVVLAGMFSPASSADQTAAEQTADAAEPDYHDVTVRGRVRWLSEALESRFEISTVPEATERSLVLVTPESELIPIVENRRGRAFRKDPRLREMDLEILARRYRQHPYLQVLKLYQWQDGEKYELDYWCDVCAIVMFETGPCDCCQDDNRLRKRLVEND